MNGTARDGPVTIAPARVRPIVAVSPTTVKEPRRNNLTLAAWAMWRTHSCVPRPDSSGRVPDAHQGASRGVGGALRARQTESPRHVGG